MEQLEAAWLEAEEEEQLEAEEEEQLEAAWLESEEEIRYHFICKGTLDGGRKCLTLSMSSDYTQVGRPWYCPCQTKYTSTWEVLVQIKKKQCTFYMKAPEPPSKDIDMEPEPDLNHLVPATEELIVPHEFYPGSFRFRSEEEFDALPTYKWSDIFHFAKST